MYSSCIYGCLFECNYFPDCELHFVSRIKVSCSCNFTLSWVKEGASCGLRRFAPLQGKVLAMRQHRSPRGLLTDCEILHFLASVVRLTERSYVYSPCPLVVSAISGRWCTLKLARKATSSSSIFRVLYYSRRSALF